MPLTLDPRSQLARNFQEGMDLTDIMPGGMGMAAKMSSPAVEVLSRWIRRFRKDKPPMVPAKTIAKAIDNETDRRRKGFIDEMMMMSDHEVPPRSQYIPGEGDVLDDLDRSLGASEHTDYDALRYLLKGILKEGR